MKNLDFSIRRNVLIPFALWFVALSSLGAQHMPDFLQLENKPDPQPSMLCSKHSAARVLGGITSAIERRNYDVLSYDLTMDWRIPLSQTLLSGINRRYSGVNRMTIRIDSAQTQHIEFDADQLLIDSVKINGTLMKKTSISQNAATTQLSFDTVYNQGAIVVVDVFYTQNRATNPGDYNGFVSVVEGMPVGQNQEDTVRANLCYTQSEPEAARAWMPCNDRPYDKAQSRITVLVPEGYTVCSNGMLTIHDINSGTQSFERYTFEDTTQIATYLMMAAASKFTRFDGDPYKRVTNPAVSVPAPVYAWVSDSIAYAQNLEWMQGKTVEMLASHSDYYGEYPFNKYAQTLLLPYFGGSMEHQTNTTHHRRCLTDRWESVIAHELMHQWTGDIVTCASWKDIWLNEGGATFGEFLWKERSLGMQAAREYFRYMRDRFYFRGDMAVSQPPVYGIDINMLFNTGTTYVKGGWVYWMLRNLVGDSTYFRVMKKYFTHFSQKSIETEDMLSFLETEVANPRVPLRTFFTQWLYYRGHPKYEIALDSVTKVDESYDLDLSFMQSTTMTGTPDLFVMPVPLRIYDNYSPAVFDTTFMNTAALQHLRIRVPFVPHKVVIDEDQTILCERVASEIPVFVSEAQSRPDILSLSPNPITNAEPLRIHYRCETAGPLTIDISDAQGRIVCVSQNARMEAGEYEHALQSSQFSDGWYIVRLRVGEKIYFSRFVVAH